MRIFVGIKTTTDFDNAIKEFYFNTIEGVRWVKSENLHITLIPPWNEESVNNIIHNLNKITLPPFSISFQHIEYFPSYKPKILLLNINKSAELANLRKSVHECLRRGIGKKAFKPHVTLARLKGSKIDTILERYINKKANTTMPIRNITLFQSYLFSQEAQYKILEQITLK